MCQICEVAASEVGAGASLRLAASAAEPSVRQAAPVNLEAAHGAATTPMPEGVGAQGRKA
jgi:hypothetical protein